MCGETCDYVRERVRLPGLCAAECCVRVDYVRMIMCDYVRAAARLKAARLSAARA